MDIFSLLPLFILFYAIATILNPGNKTRDKRGQSSNHQEQTSPQRFPTSSSPKTWREKFEEMERELFSKDHEQIPQRQPVPKNSPGSDRFGTKGINREGNSGTEGSQGPEGLAGIEGLAGVEGRSGAGDSLKNQMKESERAPKGSGLNRGSLVQGVIWAEILGKPRSRSRWDYGRRH